MKNSIGIYFGTRSISIVEVKGKKVIKIISVPFDKIHTSEITEEKVPEEIKIVALLKEGLKDYKIEGKDAVITLSGSDLIVRTFEIPIASTAERSNVTNVEIKKYIPFKIEDLVSDFQFYLDTASRRYLVLFAGILKDNIDKYFTILKQLNVKITSIEYSAFSILRLIGLNNFNEKGLVGIINISHFEAGADFTVMENGFPLFSRDIKLIVESQDAYNEPAMVSEKLKTEIRISLDYFKRKFPAKQFNQLFFIGDPDYLADIQSITQELNLSLQTIDISRIIDKTLPFDLNFLKAYCCALSSTVKTGIKLNILSAWQKSKESTKQSAREKIELINLLTSIFKSIDFRVVALGVLLCAGIFVFSLSKKLPLEKESKTSSLSRPVVAGISLDSTEDQLINEENRRKENIEIMEKLLRKQAYLTPDLVAIANFIPDGMWLENLKFSELDTENSLFSLEGNIYREDNVEEVELVNKFVVDLREDKYFSESFKDITVNSVDTDEILGKKVTHFIITGRKSAVK